jgi:putative exosortase-associated protein (TIGR04073 family)
MKLHARFLASVLLSAVCIIGSVAQAEPTESYGDVVGRKALNGIANITTGSAEIPKNVIIVNNQYNVVFGVIGGSLKGLLHTIGRLGVGMFDLFTAPIPTYPIIYPAYVWDDFYAETTYGPAGVPEPSH